MKLGSIREVSSRAEHLHGEQQEVESELRNAEQQSNAAARQHAALMSQLRSLPDGEDSAAARANLEAQVSQAEAEWQRAQSDLAQAEARQEALNREIASVTADAQEYLRSVEGNIEAAQGAAGASPYGTSAIANLISNFQQNKGLAERVLQLFGQAGGAGAAAGLGGGLGGASGGGGLGGAETANTLIGAASGSGVVGAGVPLNSSPESVLHPHGNEVYRQVSFLPQTRQGRQEYTFNGEKRSCFNDPWTTGTQLNSRQGTAIDSFRGTCGLASCENVARLAGKDISEADVITVATSNHLCAIYGGNPGATGGTTPEMRQQVLGCLGIDSYLDPDTSVDHIAECVESGRGVIASVDVARFWDNRKTGGGHAITVTSVERDTGGNVTAFYVCDSGSAAPDYARRVDASRFSRSLIRGRELNVTSGAIR